MARSKTKRKLKILGEQYLLNWNGSEETTNQLVAALQEESHQPYYLGLVAAFKKHINGPTSGAHPKRYIETSYLQGHIKHLYYSEGFNNLNKKLDTILFPDNPSWVSQLFDTLGSSTGSRVTRGTNIVANFLGLSALFLSVEGTTSTQNKNLTTASNGKELQPQTGVMPPTYTVVSSTAQYSPTLFGPQNSQDLFPIKELAQRIYVKDTQQWSSKEDAAKYIYQACKSSYAQESLRFLLKYTGFRIEIRPPSKEWASAHFFHGENLIALKMLDSGQLFDRALQEEIEHTLNANLAKDLYGKKIADWDSVLPWGSSEEKETFKKAFESGKKRLEEFSNKNIEEIKPSKYTRALDAWLKSAVNVTSSGKIVKNLDLPSAVITSATRFLKFLSDRKEGYKTRYYRETKGDIAEWLKIITRIKIEAQKSGVNIPIAFFTGFELDKIHMGNYKKIASQFAYQYSYYTNPTQFPMLSKILRELIPEKKISNMKNTAENADDFVFMEQLAGLPQFPDMLTTFFPALVKLKADKIAHAQEKHEQKNKDRQLRT